MIQHKDQRVGVFIDIQNMYYSARNIYGCKVDFGKILETAVAGRQLIRAIAYVVKATGEEQPFFQALSHRGFETKERELQIFDSGARKADWDVGIAVDAIRIGEILDVIVLVSGDGDFVELVEYLKHHGRQVEVIAFRESSSSKLVEAADEFTDLSLEKDKYLIKGSETRPPARKPQNPVHLADDGKSSSAQADLPPSYFGPGRSDRGRTAKPEPRKRR